MITKEKLKQWCLRALAGIGILTILKYAVIGAFCSAPHTEQFQPHKMSQVAVPPQRPARQRPHEDNPIQRITENLQRGLDSLPQYKGRDYQPPNAVFTSYPWREYQPPPSPCFRSRRQGQATKKPRCTYAPRFSFSIFKFENCALGKRSDDDDSFTTIHMLCRLPA